MISPEALWAVAGAAMGSTVGVEVTARLHASTGFWSKQIGRSRFRRANIPVGFVVVSCVALFFPLVDDLGSFWTIEGVAVGMGISAIAWAWVDPHG